MASPLRAASSAALVTLLLAATAHADKVANVHARGPATLEERTTITKAGDTAATKLGHTTIPESEVLQGEAAAGPLIGSSEGLVAVGKTTGADWVVEANVSYGPEGVMHVELKACQTSSGRVETLVRDLDPKADTAQQIGEMLALLLRPQGVGDDPIPWLAAKPKPPAAKVEQKVEPPPKPAPPPPRYGEGGNVAVGAGGGFSYVLARPDTAVGSKLLGAWSLHGRFAVPVPRLEVGATFAGLFGKANALRIEAVGRYRLVEAGRFALSAEAAIGVLALLGGEQNARFLVGISPVATVVLTKAFQLDVDLGALRVAPGGTGTLAFAGVTASVMLRF